MDEKYFDALVIGAGIAGLQTASDLADQGHKVLVIEKGPSIGGMMILLSKVFPTLDCSSCITTPKMSYANNHENITFMTLSQVSSCERQGEDFTVVVSKEPRYVD
ncbi:MAG: FAD-dependent oxidoreductase, partial [Anaerolineales bacterium]|nr:FAD-dependent oxidoreductase [Anaerolineales bacterium]